MTTSWWREIEYWCCTRDLTWRASAMICCHVAVPSLMKKFAWDSDILTPPHEHHLAHTPSRRAHAYCGDGFLKNEPQLRHHGCLVLRWIRASMISWSGGVRSNTADTTKSSGWDLRRDERYTYWSSSTLYWRTCHVYMSSISADSRISDVSSPKHPAFPMTAPPIVPGSPIHGIKVERPSRVISILQGETISPETREKRLSPSDCFPFEWLRITSPSKQSVAKSVFDPPPRKNTGIQCFVVQRRISGSNSISERDVSSRKYRAHAWVPNEVSFVISTYSCRWTQQLFNSESIEVINIPKIITIVMRRWNHPRNLHFYYHLLYLFRSRKRPNYHKEEKSPK